MATRKKAPPAPKFASIAELVRARIREGKTREEIQEELQRDHPDYKPWRIAFRVYEKELRAKGELKEES
jgi:hypothetical protein